VHDADIFISKISTPELESMERHFKKRRLYKKV